MARLIFTTVVDGTGARIVRRFGTVLCEILRDLQSFGVLTVSRENAALRLAPAKPSILTDFRAAVNAMKDSSLIFVTGIETIDTGAGPQVNSRNLVRTSSSPWTPGTST
ncbi:MAG: hypothetical protein LBE74_04555 [Treponema sp.]|jgi:hypothetical protein|nr:hypothetical protein [Treponema sp.]